MKICLEGKPISKMRARYANRGNYVITYDPQAEAKESVSLRLMQKLQEALNNEIDEIAKEAFNITRARVFEVELWFYLPTNESDSEAQKNAKLWGLSHASNKPDYDNLEKFYLDCATGILWPDDRMIVDAKAYKRYGNPARVEMIVMPKEDMKMPPRSWLGNFSKLS